MCVIVNGWVNPIPNTNRGISRTSKMLPAELRMGFPETAFGQPEPVACFGKTRLKWDQDSMEDRTGQTASCSERYLQQSVLLNE